MCGAACMGHGNALSPAGLSPRVRGSPWGPQTMGRSIGPIPACAGQPGPVAPSTLPGRAYPRVCGAAGGGDSFGRRVWGLSPRVRGSPDASGWATFPIGPIPACAGQPIRSQLNSALDRAYPRVCGAAEGMRYLFLLFSGLSPRVRGSRGVNTYTITLTGPIPACAGQPTCRSWSGSGGRAYPRVCGAASSRPAGTTQSSGLSPRVRGSLAQGLQRPGRCGPIPACAGQPSSRTWSRRC